MKVKDLKKLLNAVDKNLTVVLAKDSEGNSFSPLSDHSINIYGPNSTWSGDIYLVELTPEYEADGYTEDDLYHGDNGEKALVLWPAN